MNKNDGLPASVQARLQNHAKATGQEYNRIMDRYALERYLYRLSKSKHAERFVLKGALMMLVWLGETIRPTRDADLLGFGDLDNKSLQAIFQEVCQVQVDPDGMIFQRDTMKIEDIRENDSYGGRRATFIGMLGNARINLQIDVGIGDAVTPDPHWLDYPSLLGMPTAHLRAYRPETSIAEKFQAMVDLGSANTRMKDFFDIAALAKHETFDGATLAAAIMATFERRKTVLRAAVEIYRLRRDGRITGTGFAGSGPSGGQSAVAGDGRQVARYRLRSVTRGPGSRDSKPRSRGACWATSSRCYRVWIRPPTGLPRTSPEVIPERHGPPRDGRAIGASIAVAKPSSNISCKAI